MAANSTPAKYEGQSKYKESDNKIKIQHVSKLENGEFPLIDRKLMIKLLKPAVRVDNFFYWNRQDERYSSTTEVPFPREKKDKKSPAILYAFPISCTYTSLLTWFI